MPSLKGFCSLWLPQCWRIVLPALILIFSFFFLVRNFGPVEHHRKPTHDGYNQIDIGNSHTDTPTNHDRHNLTINLVLATMSRDDISWTENIDIPNLNVIRYVSDDLDADYHPPVAKKGREALIYLTYMHDFYDDLPDITFFTHADESPWHMESELNSSVTFAMSHLDLAQVQQRQYFNLRVSWENACPNWINTTKTELDTGKLEEIYMWEAFSENFGTDDVPEILAGPCCSQFAVTKEAIRRRPKSQYRTSMNWLVETHWDDYITGRIWEHFWSWLFRGEAVDCAIEWKTYCSMYHVCFDSASRNRVVSLKEEKEELKNKSGFLDRLSDMLGGYKNKKRIKEIDVILETELEKALERGQSETRRMELLSDLYTT
ncbi:uncharacterized protein F4822DRAFT_398964 [Hypoxylon trugodes]|uniref:uncharacterized protein n=1 Tax=Hypoxylon trugodes TaxID=326681 RepID=UPI002194DB77|nr:uncharacterized protein F4822DRAFT_398964 [Hypoxylon trugodes]KAI1389615.1 hypothetical protein F4822DRAFT_398964 [Hypoxylon trugodes]